MRVPLPCRLGEKYTIDLSVHILTGVSWFKWTQGWEYTYYLYPEFRGQYTNCEMILSDGSSFHEYINVRDDFLEDGVLAAGGYPLRGKGRLFGVYLQNGNLYAEIIVSSSYNIHIKVECDSTGQYLPAGKIIFPSAEIYESIEKRRQFVLKKYQNLLEND